MNSNGLFSSLTDMPVIGVAIGLIFTYLIASLVASAVKEAVAAAFQWRGTYLQQAIGVLLSHAPGTAFAWGGALEWLSAHFTWRDPTADHAKTVDAARGACTSMVAGLELISEAAATPTDTTKVNAARKAVADAAAALAAATNVARPARGSGIGDVAQLGAAAATQLQTAAGSLAANDLATANQALATFKAALAVSSVQTHPLLKGTPAKLPSYVPAQDFATALLEVLRDGSGSPLFTQAEHTVRDLPNGDIKRILSAFIQDAAGDLDKLRTRIEKWFDDSMDRLSGIYKRTTQWFLLALGLLIAIGLNVDSVHLATALWNQPGLRAQMVAQAQAELPALTRQLQSGQQATADAKANADAVRQAMQRVQMLPQPVGWGPCSSFLLGSPDTAQAKTAAADATACPARDTMHWLQWDILAVVGWLITAFAISLGAPFWFDLLQNFMNLRAAGDPPQRADTQAAPRAN